jgi:hypothetical protein
VIEDTVHPQTLAGDGFAYAGDRAEARRKKEVRAMTERPPERVEDARRFYAPEYRAEISRLTALGVEGPEEDGA